jgi:hypothetical protein
MVNEKKKIGEEGITSSELEYILDVNKKAIEINLEVEKQNEQTLSSLERIEEKIDGITEKQKDHIRITEELVLKLKNDIETKIEEIEKNLFRLVIILGSAGVGTILTIIQAFLHK